MSPTNDEIGTAWRKQSTSSASYSEQLLHSSFLLRLLRCHARCPLRCQVCLANVAPKVAGALCALPRPYRWHRSLFSDTPIQIPAQGNFDSQTFSRTPLRNFRREQEKELAIWQSRAASRIGYYPTATTCGLCDTLPKLCIGNCHRMGFECAPQKWRGLEFPNATGPLPQQHFGRRSSP